MLGNFKMNIKHAKSKRILKQGVLDYKHLENILTILIRDAVPNYNTSKKDKTLWKNYNLLTNFQVMKGVLSNNLGGEKTKDKIAYLNETYKNNSLFQQAKKSTIELDRTHDLALNDKNISMIVRRLKGEWDGFFTKIKEYYANRQAFIEKYGNDGQPKPPKPKKLSRIYKASLPLEEGKWSLKTIKNKDFFRVTLHKKQVLLPLKHDGFIKKVGLKNIKSAEICVKGDKVELSFMYHKTKENGRLPIPVKVKKTIKSAGLDIGINNLIALFVDDKTTQSLIVDGRRYKSKNKFFNKKNAKLNQEIAKNVLEYKLVKRNDDEIKIPIKYNHRGEYLKNYKQFLQQERESHFEGEWQKLSSNIVKFCRKNNVNELVLSSNLSFAKTKGDIKSSKKNQQHFYQIPFGRLLALIKQKCEEIGIKVEDVDEAHTSKSSCIYGDVNKMQELSKTQKLSTTDYKGSRVERGMYRDKIINKIINADLNGAVNHIKLAHVKKCFKWLKDWLFKVANPIKVKSNDEFSRLLAAA